MSTYNPYSPQYAPQRRRPLWPLLLLLVLAGVLGFLLLDKGLGWRLWPHHKADLGPDETPRPIAARGSLTQTEDTTIAIYKEIAPCVVHVTNLAERRDFFNLNVQQIPRGTGTGFVWDDNGLIVTNAHVVQDADAVRVVLADKERSSYPTRTWVSYPDKDLAVIHIDAPKEKLHKIPRIGTSSDLQVGQNTYAIGNPFGLDQTLTTGIISALNREIKSEIGRAIQGVIQTSAAINPGNSGGPLLDSSGNLIGVNTAILSPSGTFAGIGFAIPVDEVNQVVPSLVAKLNDALNQDKGHREVSPPRLGVQMVDDQLARRLGVKQGALILMVAPGSPAAQAGLRGTVEDPDTGQIRLGDIIVAIDGKPVKSSKDVMDSIQGHKVGDTLTLTILRRGQRQDVSVTLATISRARFGE
jgi:S1-C subfamily serine protease